MTRLAAILCLCVLAFVPPAFAEEPADSIQNVITDQISAFQANDVERAFTHASPNIQQKFGDPGNFGRMVQMGYPMVWRPKRYEMRELVETDAGLVQVVLIEDASGSMHEAGYLMQQIDGLWRINGVHVRALPQVGA